ncbi:MAG: hypothetical protein NC548_30170 [Lachnospiraceae bacterium]|nr:hypothetical protein [Lachnospiraceae bacterium]
MPMDMKRSLYTTSLILFSFSFITCGFNDHIESELSKARFYMQDSPDSALSIIQRINYQDISQRKIKAEYALLYSMALDKNHIDIENDSLIRIAKKYYRNSKDLYSKFLSSYYHGRVLCNRGEYKRALLNFLRIEEDGEKLGDSYLMGLLYQEISKIYESQYDYSNTLRYALLSYDNYIQSDKFSHACYALFDIGDTYYNLEKTDSAEIYYSRSLSISEREHDTTIMRLAIGSLALVQIDQGRPDQAMSSLWKLRWDLRQEWNKHEIVTMALSQQMADCPDSARYYLSVAEPLFEFEEPASVAHLKNAAATIHMKGNEWEKAAHEILYYASIQDSLVRIALKQSYANAHRDFFNQQRRIAQQRLRMTQHSFRLTISFCVVIIVFIGFIAYVNYKKRQYIKSQYISTIDEIKNTNKLLLLQLENHKQKEANEIRQIIKDRYTVVNELAATYYEHKNINEQRAIFAKVKSLLESYSTNSKSKREIETVVNICYDNVMQRIREEIPTLKESEYNLLSFVFAGFSPRVISVFTGDSINYTAVKKSRLKAKITASNAKSKDIFLKLMS